MLYARACIFSKKEVSVVKSDDVARHAGVSRSTVSRVLSGSPLISSETRERVYAAAAAIGYEPDLIAQSLAKKRSNTIAIGIFPENPEEEGSVLSRIGQLPFHFYLEVLKSIEDEAAMYGYDLLLPSRTYKNPPDYIRSLRMRHAAGVIMVALHETDPRIQAIAEADIPTVFVDAIGHGNHIASVKSDNIGGTHQAMNHLFQLGHRQIAIFSGHMTALSGLERLQGCRQALEDVGVMIDPELIRPAGFGLENAYKAAIALLEERRDFTAIFAASDVMAVGVLRALREHGIRVPADVSLVGFDDIDFSSYTDPSLTTVRQDAVMMGQHALSCLRDLLEGMTPAQSPLIVPTQLIVRDSTGPAPA